MPPKRLPPEERRAQIIEAAIHIFAKHGFEGTKTKDIADACGINVALIYSYFKTKEELYTATMVYLAKRTIDYYKNYAADAADPVENLKILHHAFIRDIYGNPEAAVGAIHDALSTQGNDVQRQYNLQALATTMDFVEGLVVRSQEEGKLRPDIDPVAIAAWIRGYCFFSFQTVVCGLQDRIPKDAAIAYLDDMLDVLKPSVKAKAISAKKKVEINKPVKKTAAKKAVPSVTRKTTKRSEPARSKPRRSPHKTG